ncbi:MAG: NADH:flavin oxidoreductase/NADH oxidase family protein [Proteobacteria bacterium]|nr:NADH:flavin oxidoreductase/NADH oxidase family protein [Pseudomonadota bacterium]
MIQDTLGQPLTLPNGQVVPNRLLKSAMSETLGRPDCTVPASMATLYGRWADGGIGLSVTGNVMVDRNAVGEPGNGVLEDDRDLPELRRWASAAKRRGGLVYVQVNHPDRQVPKFLNDGSVAPSAVPFKPTLRGAFATPRALTEPQIHDIIQRFGAAARVCEQAGFDGVQIHGAHGYLVSQFLSPHTNKRSDRWGGDETNRRRFVLEVYRAMRAATSSGFGVAIKLNSADFQRGGISEEESTRTIQALADEGIDFLEVSGGTYEAYFLRFAERIRADVDAVLCVTGGFRSGSAMAAALETGAVDLVGLARTVAIDPDLPRKLLTRGDVRQDVPRRTIDLGPIHLGGLEITWYEGQLHRLAEGRPTVPDEGGLVSALATIWRVGLNGLRSRRAR